MSSAKPTIILGINVSHNASCALLVDGKIVAACQEERFSRVKNHIGIPYKSIEFCLAFAKIKIDDVTEIVICGNLQLPFYLSITSSSGTEASVGIEKSGSIFHFLRYRVLHSFYKYSKVVGQVDFFLTWFIDHVVGFWARAKIQTDISERLKIGRERITFVDHHSTHAAYAFYSSGFAIRGENVLVFTADGGGDEAAASVWLGKKGKISKISTTSISNSIAYMYMYTTLYLGLAPVEDEYKVMGLAPYGKKADVDEIYSKLDKFISVDKKTLQFKASINTNLFYKFVDDIYRQRRFDAIAGGIQKLLEVKVCEWVSATCKKYKVSKIITGGGLFANVKLNGKLQDLSNISGAYFAPSPGDESNSIGACYLRYKELYPHLPVFPLDNLYLGPEEGEQALNNIVKRAKEKGYEVSKPRDINMTVATLLVRGEIVARISGRCEFGTRALGNRSIIANPIDLKVKDYLNNSIKSRDFWMPFAPTVLDQYQKKYLKNPKNISSPFMMTTFHTTALGAGDLAAAIHPFDRTARAQILKKDDNSSYWDLVFKFSKLSSLGGVLNTSFNLHGEPIVCAFSDALSTFERSGLEYMQVEDYLIEKSKKRN